ncbi:hypothetical protein F2Q68_00011241 [Brassica cretica]|uniref:Uncharacterized protein n=1 Tax=Brassica cretica TaxID=69181 RepID=A0A8S9KV82_BRACR|nr:hypothetical protein F2Q68_00011241 [Brassica cretica]
MDLRFWPGGRLGTRRFLQTLRSYLGPRGRIRTRRSFGNPKVPSDPEVVFRTRSSCGNPEVLLSILRSYLDPEVMWKPGGSPLDPEILFGTQRLCKDPEVVWEPGGHFEPGEVPLDPEVVLNPEVSFRPGGRFEPGGCFRPGGRFEPGEVVSNPKVTLDPEIVFNPEVSFGPGGRFKPGGCSGPGGRLGTRRFLLDLEVILNPWLYKNLEVYLFQALRSFHDPETAWGPEGTVLRLPRKSLAGLEGVGVGVMTQVPGLRCFPRTPMRLKLHRGFRDGCRGRSRSFSPQKPGGRCPARGLDEFSQPASPEQDIAPVILLSQVLLRPGPCLNLEESRFPRDRQGSNGYSKACGLFRSIDLGRFRILALHVDGWQESDKRDPSSRRRTPVSHSYIFPGSKWHMTGERKRIIDLLPAYVPHDWILAGELSFEEPTP